MVRHCRGHSPRYALQARPKLEASYHKLLTIYQKLFLLYPRRDSVTGTLLDFGLPSFDIGLLSGGTHEQRSIVSALNVKNTLV